MGQADNRNASVPRPLCEGGWSSKASNVIIAAAVVHVVVRNTESFIEELIDIDPRARVRSHTRYFDPHV